MVRLCFFGPQGGLAQGLGGSTGDWTRNSLSHSLGNGQFRGTRGRAEKAKGANSVYSAFVVVLMMKASVYC
jgi:hypothetical protein